MGQLPAGAVTLIETVEDARTFTPDDPDNLAFVTQTTLSVDDTAEIVAMLKERFPNIIGPHKDDICYATTNRQEAVKKVAPVVDALIVVGAPNSSNSQRLREVAERAGCPIAVLAQRAADIDWKRFDGIKSLGITAGASAPEVIVEEIIDAFAERFELHVETVTAAEENEFFPLPRSLRPDAAPSRPLHGGLHRRRRRRARGLPDSYDIGELLSYKGIAEGVENSNFLLHTTAGSYILTLYEKRVAASDLPFFLGLMEHLAARGIACPQPVKNRDGETLGSSPGRPAAIITFLEGMWLRQPNAAHCAARRPGAGQAAPRRRRFSDDPRQCAVGLRLAAAVRAARRRAPTACSRACARHRRRARSSRRATGRSDLPQGVIHADLFPDNVFFLGERLSGLIDFYFACNDTLAYDVAICLNAWCFEPDHAFNVTKARAFSTPMAASASCRTPSRPRCRCSRAARRCASC